jgi:probable HAF family extracellular repeat protein
VLRQNGTATDLGTFGGPQASAAAINNLGQVVGFAQTSTDTDHGFLWSNGTMTNLALAAGYGPARFRQRAPPVSNRARFLAVSLVKAPGRCVSRIPTTRKGNPCG